MKMFPAVPLLGLIRPLNCKLTSCPDLEDERNAPGVTIEVLMVHVNTESKFGTGTLIGYFSVYVKSLCMDIAHSGV